MSRMLGVEHERSVAHKAASRVCSTLPPTHPPTPCLSLLPAPELAQLDRSSPTGLSSRNSNCASTSQASAPPLRDRLLMPVAYRECNDFVLVALAVGQATFIASCQLVDQNRGLAAAGSVRPIQMLLIHDALFHPEYITFMSYLPAPFP